MNKNNLKLLFRDLVHDITIEIHLPLTFCLFIELCSNLQILSLSLLPVLANIPTSKNSLSAAINHILSHLEPFKIFNPFGSEARVIAILTLYSLYFVLYLAMIGYIAYQRGERGQIKEALSKIASFITIIHTKLVFYFIHCFVIKALNNKEDFCRDSGSLACTAQRIIVPVILLVLNTIITLVQEVFCYQIHQNKQAYGIKNNLHGFVKFSHKFLVIVLFCIFEDSAKSLIFFNVFFTIYDLYILHSRLPFFNLKMLQLATTCSTISAFFSLVTISRFFEVGENLCLIVIPTTPLIVKISIMKLNQTLRDIFSFKIKIPYHAVHLPNLIEDYLQKHAILPLPDKINKSTLYSMGFLGAEIERVLATTRDQNLQITTQEIRKAAYFKAIEIMSRTLQGYPKSEVLLLSIAQVYSQVFGDSFKALDIVNKISDKNKSFLGSVSIKTISDDLAAMHQDLGQFGAHQEKRKVSHLSYFAYRHKVHTLKKYIKLEIQGHLNVWKNFSSLELDIFTAINQASLISSHSRKITNYWYKNFEGHELLYVNASLMYGLYLEIIQAIPRGGSSLIKKAYNAINNKWHIARDVIDVAVGSSAVIVASIEPDKIGKVIDASASVKHLFKTTKQGLIGTNLGVILPNFVAMKHNDYIRGYQKYFTGNIDHHINSYAKTLQDEYFKVEVTLHVSPLTHKGLNLVSYIRKLSEYQSLMIVDPRGNIVEHSKDLSLPLNLFMKKSHVKIESLCPDFKKVNQAFAALYQNPNNNDDALTAKRDDQTEFEDVLLQSPKNKNTNYLDSIIPPLSPTNQRLLSNSMMENDPLAFKSFRSEVADPMAFKSFRSEVPLSSNNDETPMIVHKNTTETPLTAFPGNGIPLISQEEAQEIWDLHKDAKELTFYPYNKKGSQEMKYKAEIEPYLFDNKWYKIIKMKAPSSHHDKPFSHEMPQIYLPEAPSAVISIADDFAEDFPSAEERTVAEVTTESRKRSWTKTHLALKTVKYIKTHHTLSIDKRSDSHTFGGDNSNNNGQVNMKKVSGKAQSIVSSQASQKMTAKRLNDSFKIERQSRSSKLLTTLLYFAIVAIVCSVCVHLIYTKNSLTEMQSSISLVGTVNMRLAKTILNWQAMMVLYSRSSKLRPIDYKIPLYQAVTINASLDVIANAKQLAEEADKFANKDLVSSLYAKTVSFWEPLKHTLFDNHTIDQFTGNQVLIDYYLWVARWNGSYLSLFNNREFLFAINNTGNDYLLTLDRSINALGEFFTSTKDKNVRLITGITTMEILFVLSPLALILIIFFIVIRTYSKLFQAICRINDQSLAKRVKQLQDLSALFEESLEDDVSCFQKFKSQGLSIANFSKKSASGTSFRRFRIQGLAMHLFKYVLFAAVLIMAVIALVVIALQKSIQDFQNLATINTKVMTVYDVGSQIRSLQSSFYISMIFYNDTTFQIRHDNPATQLRMMLETLDEANSILLSVLSDTNNEISDPVVKDILSGNVCQYVTPEYQVYCIQDTRGGEFGLLGLHPVYSQVCQTMRDWVNAPSHPFTLGVSLSAQFSKLHNNVHFVLYDIYDYLSNYLVQTFVEAADENKTEIQDLFYWNLVAVLVAMFLIRVVVLTRLQVFDLGIRRILKVIPYRIIEENKVMSCYLARTFQNELKVMKQIG